LEGVKNAIRAGHKLRERGGKLVGIRLDSGDLAWLSNEARKLLDEAGFHDTAILASNDLDEHLIESLMLQQAAINTWCVGTKLVTGHEDAALGGVYKLSMISEQGGPLQPRIKLSEQSSKISNPGLQQIRRWIRNDRYIADGIYDEAQGCEEPTRLIDPFDPIRQRVMAPELPFQDLLVPAVRAGKRVVPTAPLEQLRERTQREIARLDPAVRRLVYPHEYPVGLSSKLYNERLRLIQEARNARAGA
jgi:nicotinate phosphoribosyltransferase